MKKLIYKSWHSKKFQNFVNLNNGFENNIQIYGIMNNKNLVIIIGYQIFNVL